MWAEKDYWSGITGTGFDIMARKKGMVRLVQVKSNYTNPQVRENIKKFVAEWGNECETAEIWTYIDRKGFKKECFTLMDEGRTKELCPDLVQKHRTVATINGKEV